MIHLLLFGPPGAGKGTQSENLIAKYGFAHLSTGDLFRKHLKEATELGKLAKSYMDSGNLVPDEVVTNMVKDFLGTQQEAKGIIFDGFPRTVNQAIALDEHLAASGAKVNAMISLHVPDDELRRRIMERGKTSGRADDQDPAKVENRINVYKAETLPVADHYKKSGVLFEIEGVGTVAHIFDEICTVIDRL